MDDDADTVMPADGAGAAPAPRPTSNGTGGAEGGRATPAARRKVTLLLVGAGNRGTVRCSLVDTRYAFGGRPRGGSGSHDRATAHDAMAARYRTLTR